MTEHALITLVREGNRRAFDELYSLHWKPVVSFAGMIVGEKHASDAVQDVFVKVWENRDRLDPEGNFRNYLLKATYRSCLNIVRSDSYSRDFRSEYARRIDALTLEQFDPERNSVIRELYSGEMSSAIQQAVDRLPERCRMIFVMSYFDGMPHKDIAKRLDVSLSTVNNQVFKALQFLREELRDFHVFVAVLFFIFAK